MKRILLASIVASAILLSGCDAILESFYPEFADGGAFGANAPRIVIDGPTVIEMNTLGTQNYRVVPLGNQDVVNIWWRVEQVTNFDNWQTQGIEINGEYDHNVNGNSTFSVDFSVAGANPDIEAGQSYILNVDVELSDGTYLFQSLWHDARNEKAHAGSINYVQLDFWGTNGPPVNLDPGPWETPYTYAYRVMRAQGTGGDVWWMNANGDVEVGGVAQVGTYFTGPTGDWGSELIPNADLGIGTYSASSSGVMDVLRVEIDVNDDGVYNGSGDLYSAWRPIFLVSGNTTAYVQIEGFNFYWRP